MFSVLEPTVLPKKKQKMGGNWWLYPFFWVVLGGFSLSPIPTLTPSSGDFSHAFVLSYGASGTVQSWSPLSLLGGIWNSPVLELVILADEKRWEWVTFILWISGVGLVNLDRGLRRTNE